MLKIRHLFLLFLILKSLISIGQNKMVSPYSMYGVGEFSNNQTGFFNAMGGSVYSFASNTLINLSNPASYGKLDTMSFLFDIGIINYAKTIYSTDEKLKTFNNSLNNLCMAFPIKDRIGVSLGLIPISSVGFKTQQNEAFNSSTNILRINEGWGGLNSVYLGVGFEVYKNLFLGINNFYDFGTITNRNFVIFDTTVYYNTRYITSKTVNDFHFQAGLLYVQKLNSEYSISIGLTANKASKLNSNDEIIGERFLSKNTEAISKDTAFRINKKSSVTLPQTIGAGFSVNKEEKFHFAVNTEYQSWEKTKDVSSTFKPALKMNAGGFFKLKQKPQSNLLRRTTYLLGLNYAKTHLYVNQTQLEQYGISFGVSLPIRRSKTSIQISCEMGTLGTTKNNLIKEDYVKIRLNFSIYEKWFFRKKYD